MRPLGPPSHSQSHTSLRLVLLVAAAAVMLLDGTSNPSTTVVVEAMQNTRPSAMSQSSPTSWSNRRFASVPDDNDDDGSSSSSNSNSSNETNDVENNEIDRQNDNSNYIDIESNIDRSDEEALLSDILRRDLPNLGPFKKPDKWRKRLRRRFSSMGGDQVLDLVRGGGVSDERRYGGGRIGRSRRHKKESQESQESRNDAENNRSDTDEQAHRDNIQGGDRDTKEEEKVETKDFEDAPKHRRRDTLDRVLGGVARWLGVKVAVDAIHTILTDDDDAILNELTSRILSSESFKAIKTVRKIFRKFDEYGVVDVFKKYPSRSVIASVMALARLQSVASYYENKIGMLGDDVSDDEELLDRLAHYALFANAAYGWTMDLALRGKLHMGDLQALLKKTGIGPDDVVAAHWTAKTHRPAFFIVRDHKHKKIVLSIRGTLSARDVLTDLCCEGQEFEPTSGQAKGRYCAHNGMLEAARALAETTKPTLDAELESYPDYSLVLVGHSLGSGVAAVLGSLWENEFERGLFVYGYGTPCVGPVNAKPVRSDNIISVIGQGDPFSSLSIGHIASVSNSIAQLCEDVELRTLVLLKTDEPLDETTDEDLEWCYATLMELRSRYEGEERMFPPGNIVYLSETALDNQEEDEYEQDEAAYEGDNDDDEEENDKDEYESIGDVFENDIFGGRGTRLSIRAGVPQSCFQDLRLHARMLDISRHVPSAYETLLERMAEKKREERSKMKNKRKSKATSSRRNNR